MQPISPKEEISIKKEEETDDMCVDILSNPLYWTVSDVVSFIKSTDCAQFARLFRQEVICVLYYMFLVLSKKICRSTLTILFSVLYVLISVLCLVLILLILYRGGKNRVDCDIRNINQYF